MSPSSSSLRIGLPTKNRRRRNTGCSLRNAVSPPTNSSSSRFSLQRATSRPRTARRPGSRRCCCPAGCGRSRHRAAASARPATAAGVASRLRRWRRRRSRIVRVVGRALDAAVPGAVVVRAVPVVLTVGVVVLVVVGHQVVEREAVVRGDEVDRRERPPPVVLVQVGRTGDPGRELAQRRRLATPEVAHRVPVLAVPLRPQRREVADLVATGPDVPRFRDQLHLADHRVLLHEVEERGQPVDVVELAGQGGREVEAEAVDVHLRHPVAQRVHDQLQGVGMPHVQGVPRAGVVHVVLRLARPPAGSTPRCRCRAWTASGRGGCPRRCGCRRRRGSPRCSASCRARTMPLNSCTCPAWSGHRRVGVVRREEADRVVAPVVAQAPLGQAVVGDELVHRHQLDRGHTQLRSGAR